MRFNQRLLWAGLGLAWAGYLAPWIAHRAAALNLNGYDLAEWITRLPGVRDGTLRLGRLDFMLPLAAISLLTALAAAFTPGLSAWLRRPAQLAALIGAFSLLPEYPFILTAHADPELRPTLILGVATLLAVGATIAAGEASLWPGSRSLGAAYCLLSLAALAFAVRALVVVWPELAALFNAPPRLNWGPVALGAGAGLVALAGVFHLLPPSEPEPSTVEEKADR